MQVLGRQSPWNVEAARLGLALAARAKDGTGKVIADSAEDMARLIVDRLTRQSSEAILAACLAEDDVGDVDPAQSTPVSRALDRQKGIVRFSVALDRPLVGLGASAPVYYPAIAGMLDVEAVIPEDADVANAIGAVVGQVRETVTVFVTSPEEGQFIISGGGENLHMVGKEPALGVARDRAGAAAIEAARRSGADEPVMTLVEEIDAPEIEGSPKFVEARFIATASGRPRFVTD
jgi:hypothetical protein